MSEKEYIVTLHKDVDYSTFDAEMVATTGDGFIPGRSPVVANARQLSKRNTHYMLTSEEAESLKSDSRVMDVELPLEQLEDVEIVPAAQQDGDWTKTSYNSGLNWGMVRMNHFENVYGATDFLDGGEVYNYTLDGTGVDVVISDSGLQIDHPEFQDADGNSRVQEIDWYAESGISGTQHANHYRDFHGHGTHCAGTVSGKTYGWAKNARIYSVKIDALAGDGDSGTGFSTYYSQDIIKGWHNNKPVDPVTGVKRPTVVNMSWQSVSPFSNITGGNYRGTAWSGTARDSSKGMIGYPKNGIYYFGSRNAGLDADIEEMIDAGIHVCIASGNHYQKCDVPGGSDYDNIVYRSTGSGYYHRGGSPFSSRAFMVGNVDRSTTGTLDQKRSSSACGPAVNIYAPGTNIVSTISTQNHYSEDPYPFDTNFMIKNMTGTSMASPQICGMVALHCQVNPSRAPEQMHQSIIGDTTDKLYTTGLDSDYTNYRSLQNSPIRFAYNKFNDSVQINMQNVTIS